MDKKYILGGFELPLILHIVSNSNVKVIDSKNRHVKTFTSLILAEQFVKNNS